MLAWTLAGGAHGRRSANGPGGGRRRSRRLVHAGVVKGHGHDDQVSAIVRPNGDTAHLPECWTERL